MCLVYAVLFCLRLPYMCNSILFKVAMEGRWCSKKRAN